MSQTQVVRHIVSAANAGNAALAKLHLQKAAEAAPDDAAVWLWMGWFAESPLSAIHCLETAMTDDRYRSLAEAGLAWCKAMANFKALEETPPQTPEVASPDATSFESTVVDSEPIIEEVLVSRVAEVADDVATTVTNEALVEPIDPPPLELSDSAVETNDIAELDDAWLTPSHVETTEVEAGSLGGQFVRDMRLGFETTNIEPGSLELRATQDVVQPSVNNAPVVLAPSKTRDAATSWFGSWREPTVVEPEDFGEAFVQVPPPVVAAPAAVAWTAPEPVRPPLPFIQSELLPAIDPSSFGTSVVASDVVEDVEPPALPTEESVADGHLVTATHEEVTPIETPPVWRAVKSDWFNQEPATSHNTFDATDRDFTATSLRGETVEPETSAEVTAFTQPEPVAQHSFESQPTQRLDDLWRTPQTEPDHFEETPTASQEQPVVGAEPLQSVELESHTQSNSAIEERLLEPHQAETKTTKTILVVDDSPTVRKLVAMTLEKRGYKVVSAFDGVAAIKEIAAHNPALILMDVNMPRLDGYQLCKLVKKHESTRHIPVLMLSGKDGMFDRLRGRLVGCSGYIAKPFVPEELVETVEQHLAATVTL